MEDTQRYMMENDIPQLFEGLMTALMYEKPDDHIEFLEKCLAKAKIEKQIRWNSFITPLPPIQRSPTNDISSNPHSTSSTAAHSSAAREIQMLPSSSSPLPPIGKSFEEEGKGPYTVVAQTENMTYSAPVKTSAEKEKDEDSYTFRAPTDITYSAVGIHSKPLLNENLEAMRNVMEHNTSDKYAHQEENKRRSSSSHSSTKPLFFVLGGPGVGKGTQCAIIAKEFGFTHISAGDLLRKEIAANGSQSHLIQSCIKEGKLVPQDVILDLLSKEINKQYHSFNGFLIDGFPREVEQGIEFEAKIKPSTGLLMFDCPTIVLKERLMKRAKTSQRSDDNEETIEKRLLTFKMKTLPVLSHFRDKVIKIDANRTINSIASETKYIIRQTLDDEQNNNQSRLVTQKEISNNDLYDKNNNNNSKLFTRQDGLIEEQMFEEKEAYVTEKGFEEDQKNQQRLFSIIGPTNTGKTSLCQQLTSIYGIYHIDCDMLMKEEIKNRTNIGMTIKRYNQDNEDIPNEIFGKVLGNAVNALPDDAIIAIDGYPKSLTNLRTLPNKDLNISNIIIIESPIDDIISRIKSNQFSMHGNNHNTLTEVIDTQLQHVREMLIEMAKDPSLSYSTIVNKGQTLVELAEEVCEILIAEGQQIQGSNTEKQMADQNIIFVLGGPGSGKGTQCAKIVEKYGYCHLSTGDLLREEVKSGTPRAEQLKKIMESGGLVSQDTILELLKDAITKKKEAKGFLIDGFPRDIPQGEKFEKEIGNCKFILYFDCSNEEMTKRLLERAKSSGRVDDNEETIKKRLKTFQEQTLPVLDKYSGVDKTRKVNAERSIDEIFADVCKALDG